MSGALLTPWGFGPKPDALHHLAQAVGGVAFKIVVLNLNVFLQFLYHLPGVFRVRWLLCFLRLAYKVRVGTANGSVTAQIGDDPLTRLSVLPEAFHQVEVRLALHYFLSDKRHCWALDCWVGH